MFLSKQQAFVLEEI